MYHVCIIMGFFCLFLYVCFLICVFDDFLHCPFHVMLTLLLFFPVRLLSEELSARFVKVLRQCSLSVLFLPVIIFLPLLPNNNNIYYHYCYYYYIHCCYYHYRS